MLSFIIELLNHIFQLNHYAGLQYFHPCGTITFDINKIRNANKLMF